MRTPRELHPFTILLPRISWCHGPSNLPTPQRLLLDRRFHATGLQPDARLSQMVQQACSELLIPMVFHQRFWNIFDKVPKMDLWAVSLWISKTKCLDRKLVVEVPCVSIQVATQSTNIWGFLFGQRRTKTPRRNHRWQVTTALAHEKKNVHCGWALDLWPLWPGWALTIEKSIILVSASGML